MMKWTRPFQIPSVVVFPFNLLEDISGQKKGPMVGPCVPFVATFDQITIDKDNWCGLRNHCQIFEATFEFFTKLFLVHLIYEEWQQGWKI
jgi:hypothetical protein